MITQLWFSGKASNWIKISFEPRDAVGRKLFSAGFFNPNKRNLLRNFHKNFSVLIKTILLQAFHSLMTHIVLLGWKAIYFFKTHVYKRILASKNDLFIRKKSEKSAWEIHSINNTLFASHQNQGRRWDFLAL